jgi:hypothetical protein
VKEVFKFYMDLVAEHHEDFAYKRHRSSAASGGEAFFTAGNALKDYDTANIDPGCVRALCCTGLRRPGLPAGSRPNLTAARAWCRYAAVRKLPEDVRIAVRNLETLVAEELWRDLIAVCPFLKDHRWVLQAHHTCTAAARTTQTAAILMIRMCVTSPRAPLSRDAHVLKEGLAGCLGNSACNLISQTHNIPHVMLHRDAQEVPLTVIAWANYQSGSGDGAPPQTDLLGGAFVIPALRLMFTPGATSDLTVLIFAAGMLTHGTLPLTVTGHGMRLGMSHYLRIADALTAAALRIGAAKHYPGMTVHDAYMRFKTRNKPRRAELRAKFKKETKAIQGQVFSDDLLRWRDVVSKSSANVPAAALFLPWHPFLNTGLKDK